MSTIELDQDSTDQEYAALLVGHTVTKATDSTLVLDDGTVLDVIPNYGCGGCTSGAYVIDDLNGCDNVITSAQLVQDPSTADDEHAWSLFVFADNQRINLLEVSGDDGNGYYGTGFRINIKPATTEGAAS